MVYVQLTLEVPRHKVREAWEFYQNKVMQFDKDCVEKVGGRYIGYFYTEIGRIGEIIIMVAFPSLDARAKALESFWEAQDEEHKKIAAEWGTWAPYATVKAMRPLPGSPLN